MIEETPEVTPKMTQKVAQEVTPEVTPEVTQEQRIEPDQPVELTKPNDLRESINKLNFPQKFKDAALTILDAARTEIKHHKKSIINLIVMIGFLGGTTACSESWQRRFDAQLDPGKYSDDPNVQRAYNIFLQQNAEQDLNSNVENQVQTPELDLIDPSYEVAGAKQEYVVGAKVVVDAGGWGVNVRNSPSINSSEAKAYADGTIFIIDKLAGTRDGYDWVSVATEDGEVIGYVATAWLKPLQP